MKFTVIPYSKEYFSKTLPLILSSIEGLNKDDYDSDTLSIMKGWQTPERLQKKFSTGNYFLAKSNNKLVGIGGLVKNEVCTMFTHPMYTGLGIGKSILTKIESVAKNKGLKVLSLSSTLTAKGFYENCGFKIKSEEIHKLDYHDFRVFVMEKQIF